jgi:hypothetical protein
MTMAEFKYIAPGLRWRNALGGFRIFLTDSEVEDIVENGAYAGALVTVGAGLAQLYSKKFATAGVASITSGVITLALLGISASLKRVNERNGNEGAVVEIGYPNLLPEAFSPAKWDEEV